MTEVAGMQELKIGHETVHKTENTIHNIVQQIFEESPAGDRRKTVAGKKKIFETLIIGDLHLGSKKFLGEKVLQLLKGVQYKQLVINGDIFIGQLPDPLPASHQMVLNTLKSLTFQDNGIDVIWIRGNSDRKGYIQKYLEDIKLQDEFEMNWNRQRLLILHGHSFDRKISKKSLAEKAIRFILKPFPMMKKKRARWIKNIRSKKSQYEKDMVRVRDGAVELARNRNADIVICGHSHQPEYSIVGGIRYINPGTWIDEQNYFIGMSKDRIELLKLDEVPGL